MSNCNADIRNHKGAIVCLDGLSMSMIAEALNLYLNTHEACEKEAHITGTGNIEKLEFRLMAIKHTVEVWNKEIDKQNDLFRFSTEN